MALGASCPPACAGAPKGLMVSIVGPAARVGAIASTRAGSRKLPARAQRVTKGVMVPLG